MQFLLYLGTSRFEAAQESYCYNVSIQISFLVMLSSIFSRDIQDLIFYKTAFSPLGNALHNVGHLLVHHMIINS